MMSVPSCVGTELSSIPAQVPYLFADNAKVKTWRKKLQTNRRGEAQGRPRVGRAVPCSATTATARWRLPTCTALADVAKVSWYPLQKGPAHAQLADAPRHSARTISAAN